MSRSTEPGRATAGVRVRVDRVACTGHGICAQLLAGAVELDEWGYPVVHDVGLDAGDARVAVRLCPARALRLEQGPGR